MTGKILGNEMLANFVAMVEEFDHDLSVDVPPHPGSSFVGNSQSGSRDEPMEDVPASGQAPSGNKRSASVAGLDPQAPIPIGVPCIVGGKRARLCTPRLIENAKKHEEELNRHRQS